MKKSYKEIPTGGNIEVAGNSAEYKTGSWRAMRPVRNLTKCIHCDMCVVYCPENCIHVKNNKVLDPDLEYCKGCAICAKQCPVKCIEMKPEGEFTK